MTLLATIKQAHLQARKSRQTETVSALTSLIGDIEMVGKNAGRETTDSEAMAVIKKYIKNTQEVQRVATEFADQARIDAATAELTLYESFLPKQLSQTELEQVVADLKAEFNAKTPKEMGVLMKALKERYDGQYDGSAASAAVKAALMSA